MKTEEEINAKLRTLEFEGDYAYLHEFIRITLPNKTWKHALRWVLED